MSRWCQGVCTAAALLLLTATVAHPTAQQPRDPEAGTDRPAPVLVGGEPVLWIAAGLGPYSAQFRAARVEQRLDEVVHDRTVRDLTVTVVEIDSSSELRVGQRLLMVVTDQDAASVHAPRTSIAQQYAHSLEAALRAERQRYSAAALIRGATLTVVSTALFASFVWLLLRISASMRRSLRQRLARRLFSSRLVADDVVSSDKIERTLEHTGAAVRLLLILFVFNAYLTYVLGLFPWTRAASHQLFRYALTPVRAFGTAFVDYLPNLLFLAVVVVAVYLAIRVVSLVFRQIERGRLVFETFPSEWAVPTYKIVRALLIAFGLVMAFPYLPASKSPAFTGVSVFVGVLVSLASSSALSNIIAGTVLTYTGAFRLGDRVRVADTVGDIIEAALLATRIRTIKNEEVTIPNSLVLGSAVTNYTRESQTRGLILHTTVTIGYDAPWRQVHALLIDAAQGTPGVLASPEPFVWQTSLNDFYVTYEVNVYTATPHMMPETYAALHARIQDAFFAAGVEIMSPHYASIRDGNTIAIPAAFRPPDYRARSFRVQSAPPTETAQTVPATARPSAPQDQPRKPAS
jgi:small-conductance mechanosensitive channel